MQAYDRGPYRFKSRATLFLHLAPENSLKPYLGPAYGSARHRALPPNQLALPPPPLERFDRKIRWSDRPGAKI